MGTMLRGPRGKYSTNFTDVFVADREVQYQYVNGLLAVMVSFLVVFIVWVFILFVLKFRGEDAGCASGMAFRTRRDDDESEDLEPTDDDMIDSFSSLGSSSQSGEEDSVSKLIRDKSPLQNMSGEDSGGTGGPSTDELTREEGSFENDSAMQRAWRASQRERRTRLCFLFFGLLSLVCVPTILVKSFSPMKDAIHTSEELVVVRQTDVGSISCLDCELQF